MSDTEKTAVVAMFPFNVNPDAQGGGLAEAVAAHIGKDDYRHNKSSSTVLSVRRTMAGFIGSVRSKWNKALRLENPNAASKTFAETLKALTNTSGKGDTLTMDKPDVYDFGRKLARTVGYTSLLNEDDIAAAIIIALQDYCENNEFLSFSEIAQDDILEMAKNQASA